MARRRSLVGLLGLLLLLGLSAGTPILNNESEPLVVGPSAPAGTQIGPGAAGPPAPAPADERVKVDDDGQVSLVELQRPELDSLEDVVMGLSAYGPLQRLPRDPPLPEPARTSQRLSLLPGGSGRSSVTCDLYQLPSISAAYSYNCTLNWVQLSGAGTILLEGLPLSPATTRKFAALLPPMARVPSVQASARPAPCTRTIDDPVFLLPATGNTFHMLHDVVAAVFNWMDGLGLYDDATGTLNRQVVLFDGGESGSMGELRSLLLHRLTAKTIEIWPQDLKGVCFSKILLGAPHESSLYFPPSPASLRSWSRFAAFIRKALSDAQLLPDVQISAPMVTFIRRNKGPRRQDSRVVSNLDALEKIARDKGLATSMLEVESMSAREQLAAFARTTILVGATGAGLTNVLWMPDRSDAILFWPDTWPKVPRHPYFTPWEQIVRFKGGTMHVLLGNGTFDTMTIDEIDFAYTLDALLDQDIHQQFPVTWTSEPSTGDCEFTATGIIRHNSEWASCRVDGGVFHPDRSSPRTPVHQRPASSAAADFTAAPSTHGVSHLQHAQSTAAADGTPTAQPPADPQATTDMWKQLLGRPPHNGDGKVLPADHGELLKADEDWAHPAKTASHSAPPVVSTSTPTLPNLSTVPALAKSMPTTTPVMPTLPTAPRPRQPVESADDGRTHTTIPHGADSAETQAAVSKNGIGLFNLLVVVGLLGSVGALFWLRFRPAAAPPPSASRGKFKV